MQGSLRHTHITHGKHPCRHLVLTSTLQEVPLCWANNRGPGQGGGRAARGHFYLPKLAHSDAAKHPRPQTFPTYLCVPLGTTPPTPLHPGPPECPFPSTYLLPCQCPLFPLGSPLGPGQGIHRRCSGLVTARDRSGANPSPPPPPPPIPGEQAAVGCSLCEAILDPHGEDACIRGNLWGLSWAWLLGSGPPASEEDAHSWPQTHRLWTPALRGVSGFSLTSGQAVLAQRPESGTGQGV